MVLFIEQHQENCKICVDTDESREREHVISIALSRAKEIKKSINIRTGYNNKDQKPFKYHIELDVSDLPSQDIYDLINHIDTRISV